MQRYHSAWSTVCALAGVLGLLVAFERLGLTAAATVYVLSAALVAALAAAIERHGTPTPWHSAVRVGIVGGAISLATFGAVFLLGSAGILVLVAAIVFSPSVLQRLRPFYTRHGGRLRRPGPAAPPHPVAPDLHTAEASPPESMSDEALCEAWRRSYSVLQRSGSLTTHLLVVEQRQRYLDELERRNPSGLSGWLSSDPHAAGDPAQYIVDPADPDQPPAA